MPTTACPAPPAALRPDRRPSGRGGRWPAALLAAGALASVLGGCRNAKVTRELVVHYDTPTGDAAADADIRAHCGTLPGVTLEPVSASTTDFTTRFALGQATDAQVAAVYSCLKPLQGRDHILGVEPQGDF